MTEAVVAAFPARWRHAWRRRPCHDLFVAGEGCWPRGATAWTGVEAWCSAHAGEAVNVVVGGAGQRHLCADPALPLDDEESVAAWARHQFEHYHGAAAREWLLAPWCVGAQRGATALPSAQWQGLTQAASRHGLRLQSAMPWWPLALRAAWARDAAIAAVPAAVLWLVEGTAVTRVALAGGQVVAVDSRWLDAPTPAALGALLDDVAREGPDEDTAPAAAPAVQWLMGYGLAEAGPLPGGVRLLGRLDAAAPEVSGWCA